MLRRGLALLTGVVLCFGSVGLVQAADEVKPESKPGAGARPERKPGERPERKPGDGPVGERLKQFDKNGDGKLDDAERAAAMKARGAGGRMDPAKMQELIKKYDKDGDGKLSDSERETARAEFAQGRPAGGKPGEGRGAELLKKFDKNGDGKLDDAERAEAMKARSAAGKPRQKPETN